MKYFCLALVVWAAGCGLVNGKSPSYEYSFDKQEFMATVGDSKVSGTVPTVQCDPAADMCARLQPSLPQGSGLVFACEADRKTCGAFVPALPFPVTLSEQSLPSGVLMYGAQAVSVERVAYWIAANTLTVAVPTIDLYVAAAGVKSETDMSAAFVGQVSMLPARSTACGDTVDKNGDPAAGGATVCDVKLTEAGKSALAARVKEYSTPFTLLAVPRVVAHAGDPLPSGTIDFFLRPTVSFSVK